MVTPRILIPLLFLTAGNLLLLLTTAALVDDICRQTKEPPRCVTILMSTDARTSTATLPVLEEAAMFSAGQCKMAADNLYLFTKDPNQKGIYRNCRDLYIAALDALSSGPANLQQHNYAKLVEEAGTVESAVGGCAAAFANDAALVRANQDASVEAQAIAIIARNLH
ncbi:hypothetical protein ACS0TY_035510 [Phlomoides rotata]